MCKKTSNLIFKPNQLLDASLCATIKGGGRNRGGRNKNNSSDYSSPDGYYCCTRNQFIEY